VGAAPAFTAFALVAAGAAGALAFALVAAGAAALAIARFTPGVLVREGVVAMGRKNSSGLVRP